ncbi:hypothetical protein MmiAt1_12660 [Methanimicrococcus sp. At1]|uniref:Fido domain-containing protein n=1 Tax=Methanimicrococcus hacksteinii TaxID=3028293 RepID=A0ABU3VQJ2_9EURY|nr:Fic family protein [Methanimicrococcus sp. At1]MDV0445673.1 hypothetical protein [Methanimicrococcus sp. At1]
MQTLEQKYKKAEENNEKLLSLRPLPEGTLKSLKDYYRIGLTYSSNALEGNSLTESETKIVIEDGLTINGKPLRDIYEAVGHAKAYDRLWQLVSQKNLQEEDILDLHKLFYEMIDPQQAGVYRKIPVVISGSSYDVTPVKQIPRQMKEFVNWFNQNEHQLHPVEFAALVHIKFVFIHPFIDGNGRVARLLMNLALIRNHYSITVIPPLLRSEYIRFLETAHTNDEPFKEFIADRIIETQKDLLRLFKEDLQSHEIHGDADSGGLGGAGSGGLGGAGNGGLGGVGSGGLGGVGNGGFGGAGSSGLGGVGSGGLGGADNGGLGGVGSGGLDDVNSGGFGGADSDGFGGADSGGFGGADSGGFGGADSGRFGGADSGGFGGAGSGVNGGGNSCHKIFETVNRHPGMNAPKIADHLGISLRTTQRCLKEFVDNRQIEFRGAPKTGGYFLVDQK